MLNRPADPGRHRTVVGFGCAPDFFKESGGEAHRHGSGPGSEQCVPSHHSLVTSTSSGSGTVPTLAEVIAALPDINITVDLKERAALQPLADLLQDPAIAARTCVAGAWDGWLAEHRLLDTGVDGIITDRPDILRSAHQPRRVGSIRGAAAAPPS